MSDLDTCVECNQAVFVDLDQFDRCSQCSVKCSECGNTTDEPLCEFDRCVDCTITCGQCYQTVDDSLDEFDRCRDCSLFCEICEETVKEIQGSIGYQYYCWDCWEDRVSICYGCDEYYDRESQYNEWGCGDCGENYCSEYCYQDHYDSEHSRTDGIHDYSYTPHFIYHGKSPSNKFFGVELEIDTESGYRESLAYDLLAFSQSEDLFYLKEDGSLSDQGIEIVSHPSTLEYHLKEFPWDRILETARDAKYTSHNNPNCGLHIHVDRRVFGKTHKQRDINYSKLVILYWKHWNKIYQLSRRKDTYFCGPNYTEQQYWDDIKEDYVYPDPNKLHRRTLETAKNKDRYTAVNFQAYNTIEFRLFRGTLKPESFKAALMFTDVVIDIVLSMGTSWIFNSTWGDILNQCAKYPALIKYMESRGLVKELVCA